MSEQPPYDPYIPQAGNGGPPARTTVIQQQIHETVDIMRDNIDKMAQRGQNLESLQDKTDNLAQSAQGFRRGANRVRKQMWWKDMKMRMWIAIGIIILLVIIIVPIVAHFK